MPNYHLILGTLYVDKQWSMSGEDYSGLEWFDESPKPTQSELDSRESEAQAKAISNQQAAETAKASAIAKLTALGLTQAEINALIG